MSVEGDDDDPDTALERRRREGICNGEITPCVGFVVVPLLCPCCAAARKGARPRAAVPIPDSDDDDVIMEKEVALDAVLERRRQEAILNGEMIDLAADVGDEQLQRWVDSLAAFLQCSAKLGASRVFVGMPSNHRTVSDCSISLGFLHLGQHCIFSSCLRALLLASV